MRLSLVKTSLEGIREVLLCYPRARDKVRYLNPLNDTALFLRQGLEFNTARLCNYDLNTQQSLDMQQADFGKSNPASSNPCTCIILFTPTRHLFGDGSGMRSTYCWQWARRSECLQDVQALTITLL
jgi:hypothetical protein